MVGTGRMAPEKSTWGKQSMGIAIVACSGLETSADVRRPRARAARALRMLHSSGGGTAFVRAVFGNR
jgi:hypothetical protein